MSLQYMKKRYLQFRFILVAALICLIALGIVWFSGVMKSIDDPWVRWPFYAALFFFGFVIYDLFLATLELKNGVNKNKYLSPEEQRICDREFHSGVFEFVLGCVALIIVIYKLITHAT